MLAFIAGGFVIVVAVMLYQVFKGRGAFKRNGGIQEMLKQWQAQAEALPPSRTYPLVAPTEKATTLRTVSFVVLLLGLFLTAGGGLAQWDKIRQVRLLQTEGVETTARITDKRISSGDDSDTYYVYYTFTAVGDDERREISRKESVPEELYDQVEYGGSLPIIYVRSNPRILRIRALYTPGRVEYWPLVIFSGLGLMCCLVSWLLFNGYRTAQRLDDEGIPTATPLLDCWQEEASDSVFYYAAYALPGVGPIRQIIDKTTYDRLHVGDVIRLVYLPDRPKTFRVQWE